MKVRKGEKMYDNLPELISNYPLGMKIKIEDKKRNDYVEGKFIVDGYIYNGEEEKWYPAHRMYNNNWEIYKG